MARTTGRVEHPQPFQPKLLDSRVERTVENKLLDEFRRLQQGILLAGCLRQVLVQVAQEACVPVRVSEIVDQRASVGVDPLEEPQQLASRIAAEPGGQLMDWIVRAKDIFAPGSRASSSKTCNRYSRSVSVGWARK